MILAIGLLAALAYLPLAPRPPSLLRSVVKTAAVAVLAVGSVGTPLLAVALALCALGDWLLSRPGEGAFMGGVGAFAGGHLANVALFASDPGFRLERLVEAPVLSVAASLVAVGLAAAVLIWPRAGALRGPVMVYVPIILLMGLAALSCDRWAVALAALAFIVSDLILAAEKFLLPSGHVMGRAAPFAIWILYWGAQAGFYAAFA